ncbi:hypothetical protein ACFL0V_07395, partial [Nanoarchaeota archaeon]
MLFIGFGLVMSGSCTRCASGTFGPPGPPTPTNKPEPTVNTRFCELQGLFHYNTAEFVNPAPLADYLTKMHMQGLAENKVKTLHIYGFASIDGEGKANVGLSRKRAAVVKDIIKDINSKGLGGVKVGEVKGYGVTEIWGAVDRSAYNQAKKNSNTFSKFVRENTALKANRRFIISTRKIPKPLFGWIFSKSLAAAGTSLYGSTCGNTVYKPVKLESKLKWGCNCPFEFLWGWTGVATNPCAMNKVLMVLLCNLLPAVLLIPLIWLLLRRKRRPKPPKLPLTKTFSLVHTKEEYLRFLEDLIKRKKIAMSHLEEGKPRLSPSLEGSRLSGAVRDVIDQA